MRSKHKLVACPNHQSSQPGQQQTVSVPHEAVIEDAAADECSTGNFQIATLASLLIASHLKVKQTLAIYLTHC